MTKKALSLAEFMELPDDLKFDILHKHGVYVGKRKENGQSIVLFQLHGFYVEVFYKEYRKTIERINTSSSAEILQPYIDQVNVRDLNKKEDDKL